MPIIAACGGVLAPVVIYTLFNLGSPDSSHGWGVPTATDIAFALGILALLGNRVPNGVRVFFATLIEFFGWIFFFSPTLGSAFHYIGQIFGGGHMGFADSTAVYYLTENLVLLIAGFIGCGTLMSKLWKKFVYVKKPTMVYLSVLVYVVVFGFCVAAMVSSTFSSFLYFQF